MRRMIFSFSFLIACLLVLPIAVHAAVGNDTARFTQGIGKVVGSVFQLPIELLSKSFSQMPPIGIINGALTGTYKTVTGLAGGLWDIAGAAVPYAKYALFFV